MSNGITPTITKIGELFYRVKFDDLVVCDIGNLNENKTGVWCELSVFYSNNGSTTQQLCLNRVNLLNVNSKNGIVKNLLKKESSVDWVNVIEELAIILPRECRRGEPAILLKDLPHRPAGKYRLKPIIPEDQASILYGSGGSSKSMLMYCMAVAVQTGIPILGWLPVEGNVLILDWETDSYVAEERVKAIKKGMGIKSDEVPFYRKCSHPLANEIDKIKAIVFAKDIELILIDSVGLACGGDSMDQDTITEYFRALRTIEVTSVSVDHKPKGDNSVFGSVYKFILARSIHEIKKVQATGEDYLDIGMYHRKANDSKLQKPIGIHIDFSTVDDHLDSVKLTRQDLSEIPKLSKGTPFRDQIRALLKQGKMDLTEIAETLNITKPIATTTLNRNKQMFEKMDNKWGLHSNEK